MPNFTDAEIRSIFECLDCVYSTQYSTLDPMGFLGSTTDISNGSQGQAQTMILTWLNTTMTGDTASITKVKALVVQWDAISLDTVEMVGGSVGSNSVTNTTYRSSTQQERIQTLMQTYVPFFQLGKVLEKRAKAGGIGLGLSIPTVW